MNRFGNWILAALILGRFSTGMAATTWYVNWLTGIDSNNCRSATAACRTIGQAISRAVSGDSVRVAAGTYAEHLTIGISLELIGASASTTIIDGSRTDRVITIPNPGSVVTLANVTIRNGLPTRGYGYQGFGGGIANQGTLTVDSSTVSGNSAIGEDYGYGGGIWNNFGKLTINNSTLSGNIARCTEIYLEPCEATGGAGGGGIYSNGGTVAINNSTIAGNAAESFGGEGGGIYNSGTLTISNSTISFNRAVSGSGIYGSAHLQNSIIANNHSLTNTGGNCHGTVSSIFSLSSDNSCNLNGPGDLNNVDPKLGTFGNNGGPTQTIPLLSGSPAIDAGNPSGCSDGLGHLLKTDQRGLPRPDTEDRSGCDMGAYERQGE
jgi:hypothetical protein